MIEISFLVHNLIIPDILSSSRMPREDCPLNDESILFIFTLFLQFESSENVLFTKSSSVNSSENIELNVSLLLEF
jgi:hypothetical protein